MSDKPRVVIDTNVLLDWLVFRDPRVAVLGGKIERRELAWIACPAMRAELSHMLHHASLARWQPDAEQALAVFDRFVWLEADPSAVSAALPLRCTDPDDQMFLDLALARGASTLLTRDRALLKLARRAGRMGLQIQPP
jgi:uncharacterized protein